jgi:signal transduction histidine kinase
MHRRWGLRAKMAASYVLTAAVVVAVVEVVGLGLVVPGIVASTDSRTLVDGTAVDYASRAGQLSASLGRLPTAQEFPVGDSSVHLGPGQAAVSTDGRGLWIPYATTVQDGPGPMTMVLLIDRDDRIVASSYPARYPVGSAGSAAIPAEAASDFHAALGQPKDKGIYGAKGDTPDGRVVWGAALVVTAAPDMDANAKPLGGTSVLGMVYVQYPASAGLKIPASKQDGTVWSAVLQQLGVGLVVLIGAVPVGILFGLLSTRRLIGRLRRLATSTAAVANGDYQRRVAVSGRDEVAVLENGFNRMAERLTATVSAERKLAGAEERARIARELHDAISQDLFSLRMLAGGMRKALPPGSPLLAQVETMEQTATGTMEEMQALLLHLRPVALGEGGLVPALRELSGAYRERLGVRVHTRLEPVRLGPEAEHAVLRIVQEALANAIKHARPDEIALTLVEQDGQATVTIRDDGVGFSPADSEAHHGLGLRLMNERATEVGGVLRVDSLPGRGTTVEVSLPVEVALSVDTSVSGESR